MTWAPCPDPIPGHAESVDAIEMVIVPRAVDLGEMEVSDDIAVDAVIMAIVDTVALAGDVTYQKE